MHPRQEGIHKFLNEYNCILQEYYERTGEYPANDLNAWLIAQRIAPGRKNPKGDIRYYHHIFNNLPSEINQKFIFNRISCAKFVYVKDISLKNLIIGSMFLANNNITCEVVNFPEHTDLKEFLIPESLIVPTIPGRIFKLNWI